MTDNPFAGTGFRNGICGCKASGGRLKRRYLKQSEALEDAKKLLKDARVYACPTERRVWHVTTNPVDGAQYVETTTGGLT